MTVQKACLSLQAIAHNGHALEEVCIQAEGKEFPIKQVYRNGNKTIIKACCGRCKEVCSERCKQ